MLRVLTSDSLPTGHLRGLAAVSLVAVVDVVVGSIFSDYVSPQVSAGVLVLCCVTAVCLLVHIRLVDSPYASL